MSIKKLISIGFIVILLAISLILRIWFVNNNEPITMYKSNIVRYDSEEEVRLLNESYYNDTVNLSGYRIKVLDYKIQKTDDFLKEYGVNWIDVGVPEILNFYGGDKYYKKYTYIAIVTLSFFNESDIADPVMLNNFLIVGNDYYLYPDMDTIGCIPEFNEVLNGMTGFKLASGNTVDIQIPYLIDTESENCLELDYLLDSNPSVLLSIYPDEVYLALPTPSLEF
jgi:hypothetical protein